MKSIKCVSNTLWMLVMAGMVTSCMSIPKQKKDIKMVEIPLIVSNQNLPTTYPNLDNTIRLNVTSTVTEDALIDDSNLPPKDKKLFLFSRFRFIPTPSIRNFAYDATNSYMQRMGLDVTQSGAFRFEVDVKTFKIIWLQFPNNIADCEVVINYKLLDNTGQTIVPSSTASSRVRTIPLENFGTALGRTYAEALNNVNWDRIAKYLMVANTPKQEANAQVMGTGDTALEHTVIRWYITSTPQGADVSWRVVSSTPDVSNTNSCFVGSTPYETTESFDIKGMTYNNSGNIQIEVSCEKSGYITQRKRFNLRQAIDQKEISAKFNLIKDE